MRTYFGKFPVFVLLLLSTSFSFSQDATKKVANPVVEIYDGCIERFMGYYYAMGTGTAGRIYQSKNMVNWTGPTLAVTTDEATWLNDPKWTQAYTYKRVGAGDILYRNGVFHIYFNGIGHSYSDKPLGMYKEQCIDEPFDDYGIDVQVFQDDDGEIYYLKKVNPDDPHPHTGAYYAKSGPEVWTFKMNSPFERKGIDGWVQMTHQPGHPTNVDLFNFEGPELFKYRDNYYNLFSPNRMSARTGMYLIGAAQSDGPMNFTNEKKYPHPVLGRNMEHHQMVYKQLLHTAEHGQWSAKFLFSLPANSTNWMDVNYDDSSWATGNGGFGLQSMDLAPIRGNRTVWSTNKLYIRRKFTLEEVPQNLALKHRVDANTNFYINGNLLAINENRQAYSLIEVDRSWFVEGENIIAVEAENSCSGSDCFKFVDFGLFDTGAHKPEKIVKGQSQANYVVGPNGFERWIMYKAFFNSVSSQGIDRMHFYDKELVVESSSTINSMGYHPIPALPTFIHYFDLSIYYPFSFLNGSDWKIVNGILRPADDQVAELLFRTAPMTHYRYEIPFRILPGKGDYAAAYAWYQDPDNWLRISVLRDEFAWEYEICKEGVSTSTRRALPEKFAFLEDHPLVSHYEEPWHTLTVYKNGGNFKVELDYFSLTLDGPITTDFFGSGYVGLAASSSDVNFDALQYTIGWDEWNQFITGWESGEQEWSIDEKGLHPDKNETISQAFKGDKQWDYEFSMFMNYDQLPSNGKSGYYPIYVDSENYVRVAVDYSTSKLEVIENKGGQQERQWVDLTNKISRQYTVDQYPTTSYMYEFRGETEVSSMEILWFEGNYPYLNQTFDLPNEVKIYALQGSNSWVELDASLEGELQFSYFNRFTFGKIKTTAIKLDIVPKSGKATRAFSAYFQEELAAGYYMRCRRENDRLYIYVNDMLVKILDGVWDSSLVGLYAEEAAEVSFNGILSYQLGKVAVSKIHVPWFDCEVNESVLLHAEIEPLNATHKELVWVSADPTIASIDENNRVTRHKEGEVKLTAWSVDGGVVNGTFVLGSPNSLEKIDNQQFLLYPNPANDLLFIESPEVISKVEIYDFSGMRMIEEIGEKESLKQSINIAALDAGLYNLVIQTENKIFNTKFIKK